MSRRDALTYDVGERPRRPVPWPSLLVVVAVLVVAAVLVGWVVGSGPPATGASGAGTVAVPSPTPTPRPQGSAPTSPAPSSRAPSALPDGSDDGEDAAGPPTGSSAAAAAFARAWLDRDPKTRARALTATAVPALAEQLGMTAVANIPQARVQGAPVLEDASTYSAEFVQPLSSGTKIRIYLVADPQARYGWSAASVEQA